MSEQERADFLARELDRLLSGDSAASTVDAADPLLQVAHNLTLLPLEPSELAAANFERQLGQWFGSPAARQTRWPRQRLYLVAGAAIVGIVVIALLVVVIATIIRRNSQLPATPTAAPTAIQTAIQTAIPSATPALTASVAPSTVATSPATPNASGQATLSAAGTASATVAYSRIIIAGNIDSIQSAAIVVLGQSIQLDSVPTNLCVGDVIRIEVDVDKDKNLHALHGAVIVVTSACGNTANAGNPGNAPPANGPQKNPPQDGPGHGKGNNGKHHGDDEGDD